MITKIAGRLSHVLGIKKLVARKGRRMVDRYLAESRPHDAILAERLAGLEKVTIFDVGACECLDSIRYQRMFPQAAVHAFEANPQNALRAREMLNRYSMNKVLLNAFALSNKIGELDFFSSEGAPEGKVNNEYWDYGNKSGSLLEPDMERIRSTWSWLKFRRPEKVACTTLASYCELHSVAKIDLLHLDVQGAELMVLEGALPMIECIQAIWLEVSSECFHVGQATAADLHPFLKSHGFSCELREGKNPQWDELWTR